MSDAISIIDKSIMVSVDFSRFGNSRKASLVDVTVNADKALLRLSKRLIKSPEFDAIVKKDNEIKRWLADMALPFPVRNGCYLIPIPMFAEIEAQLQAFRTERADLVAAFLTAYPAQVKAIEAELRDLYVATDYPSVGDMASRFLFDWNYLDYGVPGRLKSLDVALFNAAKDKHEATIKNATEEIKQGVRAGLLGLMERVTERLTVQPGEKPKVFRDSLVGNLKDALDMFDMRNITGDDDLAPIVAKAKSLIDGVDADTIRKNEGLREALAGSFANLTQQVDGMVIERTRRIVLDDDTDGGL